MRTFAALFLLCLSVGCAPTRTFQVNLINHTKGPITFGLVKEGDPFEYKWASPEEAAQNNGVPSAADMWGAIKPGQTAVSKEISGKFAANAIAVLRVYEGKLDLPGILAVSKGATNRADLILYPGKNVVTVTDDNGNFTATRNYPPPGEGPAAR